MSYLGRVSVIIIYITIVLAWHSFYFLVDYDASYIFMFEKGQYKWDLVFIPLLSPLFWWLGYQYDKAKFLSEKDSLTGLYNRRFVTMATPKVLSKVESSRRKLTISVIDCDNFKEINDTYGHKTGDEVLQKISGILMKSKTKSDIVARWGGDEFLIVSPDADLETTNRVSNNIKTALHQLSQELNLDISVSIGTSVYPDDSKEQTELLIIADRKMYTCKLDNKRVSIGTCSQ
ncbi:GGDEF domain-containing protein [Bacillus sp. SCS-153A]|uniref:GGDEF domain-containing protein n=1 Tax=Rossellomorea sedimentorum TaxID=3115294 RepID=UPI003906A740